MTPGLRRRTIGGDAMAVIVMTALCRRISRRLWRRRRLSRNLIRFPW